MNKNPKAVREQVMPISFQTEGTVAPHPDVRKTARRPGEGWGRGGEERQVASRLPWGLWLFLWAGGSAGFWWRRDGMALTDLLRPDLPCARCFSYLVANPLKNSVKKVNSTSQVVQRFSQKWARDGPAESLIEPGLDP